MWVLSQCRPQFTVLICKCINSVLPFTSPAPFYNHNRRDIIIIITSSNCTTFASVCQYGNLCYAICKRTRLTRKTTHNTIEQHDILSKMKPKTSGKMGNWECCQSLVSSKASTVVPQRCTASNMGTLECGVINANRQHFHETVKNGQSLVTSTH